MRYTWGGLITIGILFSTILIIAYRPEASPEPIFVWAALTIIVISVIVYGLNSRK